jgi:hypothetical protein
MAQKCGTRTGEFEWNFQKSINSLDKSIKHTKNDRTSAKKRPILQSKH